MKKITEQQLLESARALRDYTNLINEEPLSQKAPPSFWDAIRGSSEPMYTTQPVSSNPVIAQQVPQQTSAHPSSDEQLGAQNLANVQQQTEKNFNWNDKNAIKTFQTNHFQLDGKPLVVDGLIGPQTLQALAKAGIQPPPGFRMAGVKKPTSSTQAPARAPAQQPTWGDDAEEQEIQSRIDQAQQYYNSQQSQPVPVTNTTPGPQRYALGSEKPSQINMQPIKEHVTVSTEESLARIIQLSR